MYVYMCINAYIYVHACLCESMYECFCMYINKFKSLRIKAEHDCYAAEFSRYSNDMKKTWRTIRTVFKYDESNVNYFCVNGIKLYDAELMAEKCNNYLTCIAQALLMAISGSQFFQRIYYETILMKFICS